MRHPSSCLTAPRRLPASVPLLATLMLMAPLGQAPAAAANGIEAPYPWPRAAIGRLDRADGGHCSGTLVGTRLVLTAAHCVFDSETRQRLDPDGLTFFAGWRRGAYAARATVQAIRLPPGYQYDPAPESAQAAGLDAALLVLARPPGLTPLQLRGGPAGGAPFQAIGYPRPVTSAQWRQHGCTIARRTPGESHWFTTCFAFSGNSGAPLLSENHPPEVLGILIGRASRAGVAVPAVRIREAFPELREDEP